MFYFLFLFISCSPVLVSGLKSAILHRIYMHDANSDKMLVGKVVRLKNIYKSIQHFLLESIVSDLNIKNV